MRYRSRREYRVRVDGPNGFMREFAGNSGDGDDVRIIVNYAESAYLNIFIANEGQRSS